MTLKTVSKADLTEFDTTGSLGVVTDTLYSMCRWPDLWAPKRLFTPGSKGIVVQGPPTPRNVIFPDGVEFLPVISSDGRQTDVPTNRLCFFLRDPATGEIVSEMTLEQAIAYADDVERGL